MKERIKKSIKENHTQIVIAVLGITTSALTVYAVKLNVRNKELLEFADNVLDNLAEGFVPTLTDDNNAIVFAKAV